MKSLGRLVYPVLTLPWYTDKTVNLYSSRKQRLVLLHVQTFLCQILFSTFMSEEQQQQKKKVQRLILLKKKSIFSFTAFNQVIADIPLLHLVSCTK